MSDQVSLNDALIVIDAFITEYFVALDKSFCFVASSEWALCHYLPKQSQRSSLDLPSYFSVYYNIVTEVDAWLTMNQLTGAKFIGRNTLTGLCSELDIDARNQLQTTRDQTLAIADIVIKLLNKLERWVVNLAEDVNSNQTFRTPFNSPTKINDRLSDFEDNRSLYVFLVGIPFRTLERFV